MAVLRYASLVFEPVVRALPRIEAVKVVARTLVGRPFGFARRQSTSRSWKGFFDVHSEISVRGGLGNW
jgi:hypothetical protein